MDLNLKIKGENMTDEDKTKNGKNINHAKLDRLSMTDVPLGVAKDFFSDIKSRYGNIYWVKLMDLMRKAQAYDLLIQGLEQGVPVMEQQDEDEGVKTFGGSRK
jgi:hypothetical protein